MIGRLSGTLLEKHPPTVLVDVGGVGYEVDVPMSTFYDLPATGARVTLLVQPVVREDAHLLYGFLRADERDAFRQLIRISGIGARTALAVLSGLSVAELAQAVARQDAGRLQKVPGIGRKTAERLARERGGRRARAPGAGGRAAPAEGAPDVLNARLARGFWGRESSAAVRRRRAGSAAPDGIKQSLKLRAKT